MIRCSAGTAKSLGLKELKLDVLPTTAYLMSGERCSCDCSFCAQGRDSDARVDQLARITWPEFGREQVVDGIAQAFTARTINRACVQVVHTRHALQKSKMFIQDLHGYTKIPVCVACSAGSIAEVSGLLEQGAERVSIALDAACEQVYIRNKGERWATAYGLLQVAARAFPGRIATHLIVGLGESEEEMLQTVQHMLDLGVTVALFAFTPVKGTRLEYAAPPGLDQYRRIQAAHYLMLNGNDRFEQMTFAGGKLVNFGLNQEQWNTLLADGAAFRTSGCPDCNRPYYNEKPGGAMYNYPRPLTCAECKQALLDLHLT